MQDESKDASEAGAREQRGVVRDGFRGSWEHSGAPCPSSMSWGKWHALTSLIHWTLQLSLESVLLPGGRPSLVTGLLAAVILLAKVA